MNFASKPEIGLHILSYLKPENLEKQKTYSGTLWEGPHIQKNIQICFFFFFKRGFLVLHVSDPVEQLHLMTSDTT
jgi:hypothetical protein